MAKITDYNVIAQRASMMVDEKCPDLVSKIGLEMASFCLMGIYTTNNQTRGYGQDFYGEVSVIAFENGVSVIDGKVKSSYQDSIPLCGYDDLDDDLTQIAICIQAAFERINVQRD